MTIYLAALSLRDTTHDYSPLYTALHKAQAQCVMETTWLIDVAQDALGATNALLSHCTPGDKLFMLELMPRAAWTGTGLDPETKAWIANRLSVATPKRGSANQPRRATPKRANTVART